MELKGCSKALRPLEAGLQKGIASSSTVKYRMFIVSRSVVDPVKSGRQAMAKILECAKVDPSSGCKHIVRGETVEEVLQKAAEHAKEHGIRQVTPELIDRVKANIRDA
jgi:predicted small metal-binding protein